MSEWKESCLPVDLSPFKVPGNGQYARGAIECYSNIKGLEEEPDRGNESKNEKEKGKMLDPGHWMTVADSLDEN